MLQPSRYFEKLQKAANNHREHLDQLNAIDFVAAPRIPNSTVPHPFSALHFRPGAVFNTDFESIYSGPSNIPAAEEDTLP